jgi:hypothetical protein
VCEGAAIRTGQALAQAEAKEGGSRVPGAEYAPYSFEHSRYDTAGLAVNRVRTLYTVYIGNFHTVPAETPAVYL